MGSRVPAANETRNILDHQVIGNKADQAVNIIGSTSSLMGYLKGLMERPMFAFGHAIRNVYFVDPTNGSDSNDGLSWGTALATYTAARTLNNATVDWAKTPKLYNAILLAPGVYDTASMAFPYYCHVIGCGIPGTDTAAEFNTALACLTGTMLGCGLHNLRFETAAAGPCLDVGICNNSIIEDCEFANSDAVGATALDTENCTHLIFRRNKVGSGMTTGMAYGIYARGGADKYFHNCEVYENTIFASTAGIFIQDTCTASQARIWNNRIGPAACLKGIDDNNGGSYCFGNQITAVDAIEHANSGTQCVGNLVINNGTGAHEHLGT